ncbi:myeloperoxidase isoform X1 [Prionailurus iriomotensis]
MSLKDASMVYGSEVSLALQLCNQTNHPGLLAISTCFSDNGWARLPFDNLCDDPYLLTNPSLCVPCSPEKLWLQEQASRSLSPGPPGESGLTPSAQLGKGPALGRECADGYSSWDGTPDHHLLRLSAPGSGRGPGSPREKTLGPYRGSCSNVDHRAASVFTLAFCFGHTMLQPFMFRLDSQYRASAPNSCVPLRTSFFASWRIVHEGGINPIIPGLMATLATLNPQDSV